MPSRKYRIWRVLGATYIIDKVEEQLLRTAVLFVEYNLKADLLLETLSVEVETYIYVRSVAKVMLQIS